MISGIVLRDRRPNAGQAALRAVPGFAWCARWLLGRFVPAVLMLVLISSPTVAQTPADRIRSARQASNRALQKHDLKAFAANLDPELVVVTGRGSFVPTRQAYLDLFEQDFGNPQALRFVRLTDSVEVNPDAPLAAEHGHWIGIGPNGASSVGGSYLAMWRQTAEGWKIRSELFVLLRCFDAAACERYRHR
jgi:ketosteroid isomerase-like protein